MTLFHVVYMSVATSLSEGRLDDILKISESRNGRDDLTGILIYRAGHYLQLLEGKEADVIATLERIKNDRRHSALRIVMAFRSDCRLFPEWRMSRVRGLVSRKLFESLRHVYAQETFDGSNPEKEALEIIRAFSQDRRAH